MWVKPVSSLICVVLVATFSITHAAEKNILQVINELDHPLEMRVFAKQSDKKMASFKLSKGEKDQVDLADGEYYLVLKQSSKKEGLSFRRSEAFTLRGSPGAVDVRSVRVVPGLASAMITLFKVEATLEGTPRKRERKIIDGKIGHMLAPWLPSEAKDFKR